MSKPRATDRPVKWNIPIPSSVAVAVELRLVNPARGKARYGAKAALVTQLLRKWLREQETTIEEIKANGPERYTLAE